MNAPKRFDSLLLSPEERQAWIVQSRLVLSVEQQIALEAPHDPSFKGQQSAFFGDLARLGLGGRYELLRLYLVLRGRPAPATLDLRQRDLLLSILERGQTFRERFEAWLDEVLAGAPEPAGLVAFDELADAPTPMALRRAA